MFFFLDVKAALFIYSKFTFFERLRRRGFIEFAMACDQRLPKHFFLCPPPRQYYIHNEILNSKYVTTNFRVSSNFY